MLMLVPETWFGCTHFRRTYCIQQPLHTRISTVLQSVQHARQRAQHAQLLA